MLEKIADSPRKEEEETVVGDAACLAYLGEHMLSFIYRYVNAVFVAGGAATVRLYRRCNLNQSLDDLLNLACFCGYRFHPSHVAST